ncbi:MAG: hypothetical protein GX316_03300 [Firmicutes bacterium]|nr:hypothetical protein [Bacillota bacterium]
MRLKKTHNWILFICITVLSISTQVAAQSPQIKGKLEMALWGETDRESFTLDGDGALHLNISHYQDVVGLNVDLKADTQMADGWGLDLELEGAYVDYFARDFDLRLGKQRISWGPAVGFNPTDVVNPINVTDPMGDKLSNWALKGQYYWGPTLEMTAVYVPFFRSSIDVIEPISPQYSGTPIKVPTPGQGEWAVKLSAEAVKGFDMSVMYFSGWQRTPSLKVKDMMLGASGTPSMPPSNNPPIMEGYFRPVQIVGGDFATAIGDLGLWAEAAHSMLDSDDAFTDWVVGGDYGFANGLKLVGQYFRQNQATTKQDYIMVALEQPFAMIHSWQIGVVYDLENGDYLFNPEIALSPADGAELAFGWKNVGYTDKDVPVRNLMAQMESELYLRLTMSF